MCYRPPSGDISAFLEFYDQFLAFVAHNHNSKTIIASGDFNIDMSTNSYFSNAFNMVILSNGFANLINVPTRITPEGESTLDLFITNSMQSNVKFGALSCSISDHLPVFLCVELSESKGKSCHQYCTS